MKLKEFLESKGLTQVALAEHCGVDPVTVWRWIKGDYIPSTKNAREIVAYSKGKVTYNDLMGGIDEVKARPRPSRKAVERGEISD